MRGVTLVRIFELLMSGRFLKLRQPLAGEFQIFPFLSGKFCLVLQQRFEAADQPGSGGDFTAGLDFAVVITSFLFLILYAACVSSLSLLIYQLFSNQILGFTVSAVVLAVINSAHNYSVYISSSSVFAAVFKTLSFAWHFDAASKGIIDTLFFIKPQRWKKIINRFNTTRITIF